MISYPVVYHRHKVTFNGSSSQCEKLVLNEVTLLVTWGYEDPTLFRGEKQCWKVYCSNFRYQ